MGIALRRGPLVFVAVVAVIYAAVLGVVAQIPAAAHPDVLAAAVLVDLTVVVPLLYWLLFLRDRGRLSSLVPVFLLSLVGAAAVLPAAHGWLVQFLRLLAAPAEVGLVGYLLWRMRRYYRGLRSGGPGDVPERLQESFAVVLGRPRVAAMLSYEVAILFYALCCWRRQPEAGGGASFSYHQKSGYGAIVGALVLVCLMEVVAVHVLVSLWSATVAWLLTALGVYTVAWLLGDYQAARLRPLVVGEDALDVRLGLRWSLRIPYDRIVRVVPRSKEELRRRTPGYLHAVLLVEPQVLLELDGPMQARGPYGVSKEVTRVGIAVDDIEGLQAALSARGVALSR
jgi:hypothetical protein